MQCVLLCMVVFGLLGCESATGHFVEEPDFKSGEIFKIVDSPESVNSYFVDGTKIDADVKPKSNGVEHSILIESHGKVLDKEVYRITAKRIQLVEAAGEQFSDPISLFEFPMSIGETNRWKGQLKTAVGSVPAQATILTESVVLSRQDKSNQAVMVTVKLKLDSEQTEKRLVLWFVPNEGLVKREFGTCVRERN